MSSPYIGEIRIFAGNFAPVGWNFCDGALLPISSYTALYTLIGTTYGGDGVYTFGLPDLRGRVPILMGTGGGATYVLGQPGNFWSGWTGGQFSGVPPSPSVAMNAAAIGSTGGSQPHDNMLPFLGINFIISLEGIFPSQT